MQKAGAQYADAGNYNLLNTLFYNGDRGVELFFVSGEGPVRSAPVRRGRGAVMRSGSGPRLVAASAPAGSPCRSGRPGRCRRGQAGGSIGLPYAPPRGSSRRPDPAKTNPPRQRSKSTPNPAPGLGQPPGDRVRSTRKSKVNVGANRVRTVADQAISTAMPGSTVVAVWPRQRRGARCLLSVCGRGITVRSVKEDPQG